MTTATPLICAHRGASAQLPDNSLAAFEAAIAVGADMIEADVRLHGNTLVLSAASHTLAGHMYSKLTYHPINDFVGVTYLGNSGYVIAAPGNLDVSNLADYVKLLKSKPGA